MVEEIETFAGAMRGVARAAKNTVDSYRRDLKDFLGLLFRKGRAGLQQA